MKPNQRIAIFSLVLIAMLPLTASAQTASCHGEVSNCFLLRVPATGYDALMQAHDLTFREEIRPGDPRLVMVTGPTSVPPENTLANVRAEPGVLGFEAVDMAAVTEGVTGAGGDTGAPAFQGSLSSTGTYSGPETAYFSTPLWNGYMAQPAVAHLDLDLAHAEPYPEALGLGVVAVIDTGVDPDHPLLQGALVPGYDFILDQPGSASEWSALDPAVHATPEQDPRYVADQSFTGIVEGDGVAFIEQSYTGIVEQSYTGIVEQSYTGIVDAMDLPPGFGHGTMVAGLIRLAAPAAMIMPIRAFDGMGRGDLAHIIQAIYWAVDNGANVINMSFSTTANSAELLQAVNYAEENGVVCVSSAGNSGDQTATYPATFGNTLGVGSVDGQDARSDFSSYGNGFVYLAAPGEGLITAFPGGLYAAAWGTSFSAALVAGTVALLHDTDGATLETADIDDAKRALKKTALKLSGLHLGKGRVDADAAFACRQEGDC
jgi:hypothetical protein